MYIHINSIADLANISSTNGELELMFHTPFRTGSTLDWKLLAGNIESIIISIHKSAYIGDLSPLFELPDLKYIHIFSKCIKNSFNIKDGNYNKIVNFTISKACSIDDLCFLNNFCRSNDRETSLNLVSQNIPEFVQLLPYLNAIKITNIDIPDLCGYSILGVTIKYDNINTTLLPKSLLHLSIDVDQISNFSEIISYATNSGVQCLNIKIKQTRLKFSDIIILLNSIPIVMVRANINLTPEEQYEMAAIISKSSLSGIILSNVDGSPIINDKVAIQHLLELLVDNSSFTNCYLHLDKTSEKIIKNICSRNQHNNSKRSRLETLAYRCAVSHNLDIPEYLKRPKYF